MTKIIKGDLVLTENTEFTEDIKVEGSIKCTEGERFNLKVRGDINAHNIDAYDINAYDIDAYNINASDIDAYNINASDIDALDIDARNIDALDINAYDIICEKRIKKTAKAKTIARVFVQNKSQIERKEQMP